ncbi:MAG: type III-A CRISPR-associated protein Cas10/Csm1 [Thermodesulfovibrionales bacterium]
MSDFNSNDQDFLSVVKGALLHDIGKVIQRAQDNPTAKKHTEWGYEWLKENLKEEKDELVAQAAIAHHFTKDDDYALNNNFGLIWYQADNLSAKERAKVEKENLEEGRWHSEISIASPFSRINNPLNITESAPLSFLPLINEKRVDEALLQEPRCSKEDYKQIWRAFESDFNNPDIQKPHSIDFLLMLFEKHFSRVPSITMKIYDSLKREEIQDKHPDISLYDHSKLAAAIAGCMYHYYRESYPEKWHKNELLKDEILNAPEYVKPYLLIGGDISGVQRFIYTITSKGALKSLKGRSFFLELLSEHILSELIESLNLTRCNIIFSGGGHFYILSYNTPKAKSAIETVKSKVDEYLFREFKGGLQLHLAYEEFHPDSFSNTSEIWRGLAEKFEKSKKTKWQNKIKEILNPEMPYHKCLTQSCEVCFREDLPLKELQRNEDILKVCDPCFTQYHLGEMLKEISHGDFPVIYKLSEPADEIKEKAIKLMDSYYLFKKGWDRNLHPAAIAVYRVNDLNARHYSHPKSIYLPIGIYQHKALTELSDASPVFGIDRIAVLRMDVDNLGKIFSEAVPEEYRTFSRMASISRGLNRFFKSCLNEIVEGKTINNPTDVAGRNVKEKGRMLTIVYSGGDDLFIIGHWLDVIEAAIDINNYFKKYTGNPFVTISAGVAVNQEKHPVYQYAKDAEKAERMAKDKKIGKDAITLIGKHTFKWSDIERILERVKLFKSFLLYKGDHLTINENKVPKTFFYRLLALARRFNEEGVLILPKAAYLISRARFKDVKPEDILKIKEVVMTSNQKEWKITEVATLWTLMMMRKGGDEDARG